MCRLPIDKTQTLLVIEAISAKIKKKKGKRTTIEQIAAHGITKKSKA
jgi:hypothetical protein